MVMVMDTTHSPEIYRKLMAIGLLGVVYRMQEDADIVNEVIDSTLNEPQQYRICRAIATGMTGDSGYAKEVLGPYLQDNPDDEAAQVGMAIALVLAGDEDGARSLQSVLATSTDMTVRAAADSMLSFLARHA